VSAAVRQIETPTDAARSVDIFNTVWPLYAVTTAEFDRWKVEAVDNEDWTAPPRERWVGDFVSARRRRRARSSSRPPATTSSATRSCALRPTGEGPCTG